MLYGENVRIVRSKNLFAGAAKAAGAAFGFGEAIAFFKFKRHIGHDDELGDTVTMVYGLGAQTVIMNGDDVFATVIAVTHADTVGRAKSLL